MKILCISNISNPNDLMCDSGVIFQRVLAQEFSRMGIDYRILGADIQAFRSYEIDGATKCYANLGTTRYSARFGFDWPGVQAAVEQHDPDIIFNNQVEITAAIRSLLVTMGRRHVRLVTYCHYPALWGPSEQSLSVDESLNHGNLGAAIILDIISALLTSDYFVTQSEFAKRIISSAASYHNVRGFREIGVIPPPADPLLLDAAPREPPRNRQILYNHRLYQTYGTAEFLELIDKIASSGIELIVSDPMPSRSALRQSLSASPAFFREQIGKISGASLFNGNVERHEYRTIISRPRVSFAAFRKACVWSMASVDCMGLGVPVLAPSYAAYPEFIPSELLFSNHDQAAELMSRLLTDDDFWRHCSLQSQRVAQGLAPHTIARRFVDLFTALK
ncbi:hypothetical protein WMF37_47310 [Sorangium sp. So ce291]|uniref:glycosyltransferase n=1 Tax=Sorangium sp. So ce291 TaxID=3133294 RepID=UPI003F5EEA44